MSDTRQVLHRFIRQWMRMNQKNVYTARNVYECLVYVQEKRDQYLIARSSSDLDMSTVNYMALEVGYIE